MSTFGERLRDALLANGLPATAESLAAVAPISQRMARRWLGMKKAHVSVLRLAPFARRTHFRIYWLATGDGPPQSHFNLNEAEREALMIVNELEDTGLRKSWFQQGRDLAES